LYIILPKAASLLGVRRECIAVVRQGLRTRITNTVGIFDAVGLIPHLLLEHFVPSCPLLSCRISHNRNIAAWSADIAT
jgi:hypothetical protein